MSRWPGRLASWLLTLCLGWSLVAESAAGDANAGGAIVLADEHLDVWGSSAARTASLKEGGFRATRSRASTTASPPLQARPPLHARVSRAPEDGSPPAATPAPSKEQLGWNVGNQAACEGKEVRYTECRRAACDHCTPVNCAVSAWSDWSDGDCTGLCMRQRGVRSPNNHCGTPCNHSLIQTKRCATSCNPPVQCQKGTDCVWDDWTEWSACTCSCDGGQRTRDRHIKVAPEGNGRKCAEKVRSETAPCNTHPCGTQDGCIDGSWGEWGEWGACSATCGGGLQWRIRQVATQANACGKSVEGDDRELRYCNPQGCLGDKDCLFGDWTEWGACSCTCSGVKHRSRRIDAYGKGNGKWCNGHTKEVAACNHLALPEGDDGCARQEDTVDCLLSPWSDWNSCTVTCGRGQHVRERSIKVEAGNFGTPCIGGLREVGTCERDPCSMGNAATSKPCIWGVWQDWSSCDKCGGQRKRFRLILQMPEGGGAPCQPQASEETGKCPRRCEQAAYCSWGDWNIGLCSVTCGVGTVSRVRYLVASSEPSHGIRMFQDLGQPAVPTTPSVHHLESVFLSLAAGCLLTLLAQWSWQSSERRGRPPCFASFWPSTTRSRTEEEMPLYCPQARGEGQWMPVDTADSDAD